MVEPYRPPVAIEFPPTTDDDHLRVLSIFHYVVGGFVLLFSCFFIFHIVMGVHMLTSPGMAWPPLPKGAPPTMPGFPPAMGAMFLGMGCAGLLLGWTMGALTIAAGRSISRRRRHLFCLIVDGLLCMWVPFGTVLGVLTLIALTKPHVRMQFEAHAPRPSERTAP